MLRKIINRLSPLVMGRRPFNTVFSFNYHNISHIVKFLKSYAADIKKKDTVLLDVGAGASPYYEILAPRIKEYIAVDMAEILPKVETRPILQKAGTAEKLPIADASVDIVMSNQVLEHVTDERAAVAESFRVLKSGGHFIGSVPHISPIHLEPWDFRRFTYYGLKQILENHGFEVIKIEGNGGVHRAMAMSVTMDWFLSKHKPGQPQRFRTGRHLLFAPITGFINIFAVVLDFLLSDKKRSPANYIWVARKP